MIGDLSEISEKLERKEERNEKFKENHDDGSSWCICICTNG